MSISKLPQWMCKYGRYSLVFYVLQDVSWNVNKLFPDIPMALQYAWCLLTLLTGVFFVENTGRNGWLAPHQPNTLGVTGSLARDNGHKAKGIMII